MGEIISWKYAMPYLIVFFILLYIALLKDRFFKGKLIPSLKVVSIFLFIFLGFRGYIYSDWTSYLILFKKIPDIYTFVTVDLEDVEDFFAIEYGYLFYMSLVKTICDSFDFFVVISSLIDIVVLYMVFKKYLPDNPYWGIALFIVFGGLSFEFNLYRNVKGVMLFLLSLKYIENKSPVRYFAVNCLGCLFHISSVIYLPLYYIFNKKFSKQFYLTIFIVINLVYLLQIPVCKSMLLLFAEFVEGRAARNILYYFENLPEAYGFSFAYIERFITGALLVKYYDRIIAENRLSFIFVNMYMLYFGIYAMCWDIAVFSSRGSMLFIMSYWFIIPYILKSINRRITYNIILLFFVLVCTMKIYLNNNNIMARYDNILFGASSMEERERIMNKTFEIINH